MTQQKQFEAWAKSQSLDTDHKEKDAWGREQYSPHIHSMWQGWQAAQATPKPVGFGHINVLPDGSMRVDCVESYETGYCKSPLYTAPPDHTAAMELALSMLHFMNDNGYRLEKHEQGRMDSAIAALEKETK